MNNEITIDQPIKMQNVIAQKGKDDWVECSLGEICEKAVKVKRKEMALSSKIKYLDIGSIDNNSNVIVGHKEYTWKNAPSRAQQIIKKEDVLFSTVRTYLKNIAQVKNDIYENEICSSGFTVLRSKNEILNSDYLFYFSLSIGFLNALNKLQTGTSYPAVRDKDVFAQKIPLPPLVVQKALVRKIESFFSSLDSGIADLKKAQGQLGVYRQAVLKKAFEGDWEKIELGKVCEKISKVKRKEMSKEKPLLYLDIGGIDNNSNVIVSHKEYTWEYAPSRAQQIVKVGDVLFSTVRTYLKNIARIEKPIYEDEIASSGFTVIRGKKDVLNSKYIFYISTSQFFLEPLNKLQRGTSYPAVRDKDVFSQLIPLPSIQEQHQIVREIESRLSVCDAVEQNIKESLEKAQALRQSILKKAFEGKLLGEEEIAKCKADAAYEPASVLLEKIKAEKKK